MIAIDCVLNDLRFGSMTDTTEIKSSDFIFSFILKEENGTLEAHEAPRNREGGFKVLIERIKGK